MKIDQRLECIRARRTKAMMEARDLESKLRDPASKHRVQEKVVGPLDDVETLFLVRLKTMPEASINYQNGWTAPNSI